MRASFFVILFCLFANHASSQSVWSEVISAEPANSADRQYRFALYHISQDENLTGTCFFQNGGSDVPATATVIVKGTKSAGGVFWPDVTFQVKNELTGVWEMLGKSPPYGRPATLEIKPHATNFDLFVNLEVFKPVFDKYKRGRVVLNSREASEFDLKSLLPPRAREEARTASNKRDDAALSATAPEEERPKR